MDDHKSDTNTLFVVDGFPITRAEIGGYMANICSDLLGIELAQANSHQFSAILAMTGDHFFSRTPISRNNDALRIISDYYLTICRLYGKLPSILDFCDFTGCDPIIWEDAKRLNPDQSYIAKTIIKRRENSLKMKCYDSNSIVGAITVGNTEFYWNNYGLKPSNDNRTLTLDTIDDLQILEPTKKSYDMIDSIIDKDTSV